jgi:hypothetical protein
MAWLTGARILAPTAWATPPAITPGSWTLAVLPDTQLYAEQYPAIYTAQTQFLANYKNDLNLAFVLHEGDNTDDNLISQWVNASNAMEILDAAAIPYALVLGNHDLGAG